MNLPSKQDLLNELLSEDLSGVVFVRDYLQLQFNPQPSMSILSTCKLVSGQLVAAFREESFPNQIIALIGQRVVSVADIDQQILIGFENGSRLEISYAKGTFVGEEAVLFYSGQRCVAIWP